MQTRLVFLKWRLMGTGGPGWGVSVRNGAGEARKEIIVHDYQCLLLLCLLVLKKVLLFSQLLHPVYGDVHQGSPARPIAGAWRQTGGNLEGKCTC